MTKFKFAFMALSSIAIMFQTFTSCKDEEKEEEVVPTPTGPTTSTSELISLKTTSAPVLDGTVDAAWANCDKLTGTATVPNISDFNLISGEKYNFTLRSMYDASNLYLLLEYDDATTSIDRQSWFFDAATKRWKQQNKYPATATDRFYEDKFAFLWPTSTANSDWNTSTCYSTCHSMPTGVGYSTERKHYAEAGETVDMWHWKLVRTGVNNQVDDQRIVAIASLNSPTTTEKADGGRGSDAKTSGGYADNKQTLNITGGSTSVSVPKYVIPDRTSYAFGCIGQDEIDNGTAKLVTAVDSNGVLTYAGGTIDPNGTSEYATGTGAKRFPSIINQGVMVGSRGDITCYARNTGSKWVIEIKRSLVTSDAANDVQWDVTKTYMFGLGIFQNAAIAHGIKPNLLLKFK